MGRYWARIKRSLRGCSPRLSLRLSSFEEGFCLDVFGFLLALPFLDRWHREPYEIMDSWGAYWHASQLVFCWGSETHHFNAPWMWTFYRRWYLRDDGQWAEHGTAGNPETLTVPYHYTLQSGEVQERLATVRADRMEWRWLWLRWSPWPRKVATYIDVTFDGEVGEGTGSWKGGCIGCGYDMLPGESMLQTLRRMEADRKF